MPKAKPHPHPIEQIIAAFDPEKLRFTTADGATVGPGDSVWDLYGNRYGVTGWSRVYRGERLDILGDEDKQPVSLKIGELYSSERARLIGRRKWLLRARADQEREIVYARQEIASIEDELAHLDAALASQE